MRTDIQSVLARHPGLLHRARFVRMRFEIRSSSARMRVEVEGPQLQAAMIDPDAPSIAPEFVLEADASAWREFGRPVPQPEFHDVLALIGSGHARFEGDALPFYANLFLVKGIVAAVFREDGELW